MSSDSQSTPHMKKTLGLTGLTMNAMALIAPGAFLWLTFQMQSAYGAPMAGCSVWFGIFMAIMLCYATAIAYAELSKLYPGAGSSYYFAEQAFLSKTHAYKFARLAKYITGWASHLYYWVYPGLMVGVTAILMAYLASQLFPEHFNGSIFSPTLMVAACILLSFGISYIAQRGINGSTGVAIAINIIQISALLVFSVIALGYRSSHGEGSVGWTLDPEGHPINVVLALDKDGNPFKDEKTGEFVVEQEDGKDKPFIVHYAGQGMTQVPVDPANPEGDKQDTFQFHESAGSVVAPHGFSFVIIQACIAILILVGFESVTSMGEEARNAQSGHSPSRVVVALCAGGCVLFVRILRGRIPAESGLHGDQGCRLRRTDWRHDGARRNVALRQSDGGLVVHVYPGHDGVPGLDRYDLVLHEHRRPGDLRDGPG